MPHMKRITVDTNYVVPTKPDGTACYLLTDSDGQILCRHRFHYPVFGSELDIPAWFNANLKIAQALADALSAAPSGAIEYIRQAQREAQHLRDQADKPRNE